MTETYAQYFMKQLASLNLPDSHKEEKLTAQELTYQHLRYAIMIGSIAPGESLTIRGLAETLNVSPTPIREALRRLSTEGALEVQDNRRVCTPQMDRQRFDELISLRKLIERHAAESAMPYVNQILVDELEQIDNELDAQIEQNNHEKIVKGNQQFHTVLYKANPNQVVMPIIESIWLQLGPYTRIALSQLSEIYLIDHHKAIIKALRNQNLDALKKAITNDIDDGIGKLGRVALKQAQR